MRVGNHVSVEHGGLRLRWNMTLDNRSCQFFAWYTNRGDSPGLFNFSSASFFFPSNKSVLELYFANLGSYPKPLMLQTLQTDARHQKA